MTSVPDQPPTLRKSCSAPACKNTYPDHHWGAVKAHDAGWFLQKNKSAWCPQHVPDWVKAWRRSNKAIDEQREQTNEH